MTKNAWIRFSMEILLKFNSKKNALHVLLEAPVGVNFQANYTRHLAEHHQKYLPFLGASWASLLVFSES